MTLEDWFAVAAILLCLLASFFFAGSETALTASSRATMLRLQQDGNRNAGIVNRLLAARERLIGALLLGNNAVNILASSLATSVFLVWFGDVGVIYATGLMTVLVVVFAEVLPKTIAFNAPDRMALAAARPMAWWSGCSAQCWWRSNGWCASSCAASACGLARNSRSWRRTRKSAAPSICCTARAASKSSIAT